MDSNHPIRNFVEQNYSPISIPSWVVCKRGFRDPYNPFPKIPRSENFPNEFVYVGGPNSFHTDPITSELQYCLFTCPGTLYPRASSSLDFRPLPVPEVVRLAPPTETFWTGGVFEPRAGSTLTAHSIRGPEGRKSLPRPYPVR